MKCPHCGKQVVCVDQIGSSGIWACPECKEEMEKEIPSKASLVEPDSLFYITIPPHSDCEIRWASQENSEKLDSKILCSGPLRIAVIAD